MNPDHQELTGDPRPISARRLETIGADRARLLAFDWGQMLNREQPSQSDRFVFTLRSTLVQSRAVIGLVLVVAAGMWAAARGVHYYGLNPVHLVYDLDQPPWLLLVISTWLWYRSRRR